MEISFPINSVGFSARTNSFVLGNTENDSVNISFQAMGTLLDKMGLTDYRDLLGHTLLWDGITLRPHPSNRQYSIEDATLILQVVRSLLPVACEKYKPSLRKLARNMEEIADA